MSNTTNTSGSGVGFGSLLTLLFIGLKLGHVIDWSWWWVLCPLWIPVAIFGAFFMMIIVIGVVVAMFGGD